MFKIAVNDAHDANIFADPFQIGDQGAHTADQQIDLNPGTGRCIQTIHQPFIDEVVELQRNASRQAVLGISNLFVDHIIQQATGVLRRHQQVVEADRTIRVLNEVKDPAHLVGDARIGGKQRVVGVNARRLLVKVAGTDVGITHDIIPLFTGDEEQLGVDLQPRGREDHVYARFGQTARPVNVGLFIEACLQLYHHGDFLPVMGGMNHRIDNAGVFRHAVDVDFNRQHVGIERCLTHQLQHVFKGVVRIVEQDVALADGIEAVAELIEPNMAQARQRLVHQVGFADVREADKVFKVVIATARHDGVVAGDCQLFTQHLDHRVRHITLIHKAHRLGG